MPAGLATATIRLPTVAESLIVASLSPGQAQAVFHKTCPVPVHCAAATPFVFVILQAQVVTPQRHGCTSCPQIFASTKNYGVAGPDGENEGTLEGDHCFCGQAATPLEARMLSAQHLDGKEYAKNNRDCPAIP